MKKRKGMNRRNFIKSSTLGVVGAGTLIAGKPMLAGTEEKANFPRIKEYRTLGRTGFKASDIGIGTSRQYPVPVMTELLKAGVNYIDTSERYGRGESEKSIAQAIKGWDRKKLFISSKLSLRKEGYTKEEVIQKVQGCLQRLQTEYIDCILIHGAPTVDSLKNESFHQAITQLKKENKIRFIGVSNHGPRSSNQGESMEKVLLGAVADGRYDLLLLVYNFLQKEAGERILEAAAKNNIATTIMKSDPMGRYWQARERVDKMKKEGKPINDRMKAFIARMEETAKKAEPFLKQHNLTTPGQVKDAAIRYVLSNSMVHTLNLAFQNFEDISIFLKLSGTRMTKKDIKTLALYQKTCGQLYCRHACGICESQCPKNVPVNTIMRYNHYFEAHNSEKYALVKYSQIHGAKADLCQDCAGFCEQNCPYGVPIQGMLNLAHQQLTLT